MSRILTIAAVALAIGAAATLYQVKYEVRLLEQEARQLHQGVAREQQAIQVLSAEWAYLNQPARIQELAERYLDLKPIKAAQIGTVERLPLRPVAPPAAPGADGLVADATPGAGPVAVVTTKPAAGKPAAAKPAAPAATKPVAAPAITKPVAAPAKPAAPKPAPAKPATTKPPAPAAPTRTASVPAAPARPAQPAPRPAPVPSAVASAPADPLLDGVSRIFASGEPSYPTERR
ncbi:cell division protein FtsL [Oleomonas cavernae]|uniref:cell division protein FtsL n=1 Tax=Oleomonas cavernae TaxID=2320859 RepID=UPI0018F4555B|nr:hypothetical protein [Oleomonas cavernae]